MNGEENANIDLAGGSRGRVRCGLGPADLTVGLAQTGAAAAGTANVRREAVLGTGRFTAFVENMNRSLAFYHAGQIRRCSLCSILRELKNVISRRESLAPPSLFRRQPAPRRPATSSR